MKQSIRSLALVIRSKNAGPYELVLDILFKQQSDYLAVKASGQFTAQLIARLLDSLGKSEGILGTIAGDDTIFTTPASGFTVKDLYEAILVLFEQEL